MIIYSTLMERIFILRDLANSSNCNNGGWDYRNNKIAVGRLGNLKRYTGIYEN
jgi:hypothetical protein